LYNFLIRLIPPYFYEADAWFSIVRRLEYTKVILIYSQEEESRMVAERFQLLTDDSEIQVRTKRTIVDRHLHLLKATSETINTYQMSSKVIDY
jgi:hypothetical protein